MIADAAQARTRERVVADARMRVRGDDQVGVFGDRAAFGHEPGIFDHVHGEAGLTARHGQTIIGGRRHDAGNLDAVFLRNASSTEAPKYREPTIVHFIESILR